jgi:YggT family protein
VFDQGGFFNDVKGLIVGLLEVYSIVILVRVVISWLNPDPNNPIVHFLRNITDPPLNWLRQKLPGFMWSSGLDFTPVIFLLGLRILISLLQNIHI